MSDKLYLSGAETSKVRSRHAAKLPDSLSDSALSDSNRLDIGLFEPGLKSVGMAKGRKAKSLIPHCEFFSIKLPYL
jgi:hypothetical protein